MGVPEIARRFIGGAWQTGVAEDGNGGSQPPTPFVQVDDPGAVGAGAIWVDTSGDPPVMNVRNANDDGWEPQTGIPQGGPLTGDLDADGKSITDVGGITGNGGDWGTGGGSVDLGNGSLIGVNDATMGGTLSHEGAQVGFYGAGAVSKQVVPLTVPTVQNVIDALVTLGLIAQSD